MSVYSDTDEEWQLEGGPEQSHEPVRPGSSDPAAHGDALSVTSTTPDIDLGEDFENVTTEDLQQQIEELTLQNSQMNVDDDSSSAAGRLSRQGLELQLETLRAQNLTLQQELLNLPPQAPASQSPAPADLSYLDPFCPVAPDQQTPAPVSQATPPILGNPYRTSSPAPPQTSHSPNGSSQVSSSTHDDMISWTASFPSSTPSSTPTPALGADEPAQPAQAGRSSPVTYPAIATAPGPAQPVAAKSANAASADCSLGSGHTSPRSTLGGPSAHGSPAGRPSDTVPVTAASKSDGTSLTTASRSVASTSEASCSISDSFMDAIRRRRQATEAARIRLEAESGSLEVRREEAAQATLRMDRIMKGLDLAFLFDITGSMEPWIRQAASKAKEIMDAANEVHEQAFMRMAFVGYRDYGDVQRFEIMDFVEKEGFPSLQRFLDGLVAKGGDDSTEDIAGGLKAISELSWRSTTRLVIHFGDYPCHGKQYHGQDWEQYDRYPVGDPEGLIPETYLEWLASKRTDYYFAELTPHTAMMASIFEKSFPNEVNAKFKKMDMSKGPKEFLPSVINSLRSSMSRSSVFGPAAARSGIETRPEPQQIPASSHPMFMSATPAAASTSARRRPRTLGRD